MDEAEVKAILESWLNGTLDSHEWDNFISVKNKNSGLEKIRLRAEEMWVQDSAFLQPGAINPCSLSEVGRSELVLLLGQLQAEIDRA